MEKPKSRSNKLPTEASSDYFSTRLFGPVGVHLLTVCPLQHIYSYVVHLQTIFNLFFSNKHKKYDIKVFVFLQLKQEDYTKAVTDQGISLSLRPWFPLHRVLWAERLPFQLPGHALASRSRASARPACRTRLQHPMAGVLTLTRSETWAGSGPHELIVPQALSLKFDMALNIFGWAMLGQSLKI